MNPVVLVLSAGRLMNGQIFSGSNCSPHIPVPRFLPEPDNAGGFVTGPGKGRREGPFVDGDNEHSQKDTIKQF
jgi:hypothetical protein